jgi:hypothetical protein
MVLLLSFLPANSKTSLNVFATSYNGVRAVDKEDAVENDVLTLSFTSSHPGMSC